MHIYTAAVYTNTYGKGGYKYVKLNEYEQGICDQLPHILESWHYVGKQKYVDDMRRCGAKVFLDSGAFSAHTLGVNLSVEDYCGYIQRNKDILRVEDGSLMASVLDGIGDPLQTYRNQLEMEARGVRPLPCFHKGEDERWLEWYMQNYEYITIGGMVGSSAKQLEVWLDRLWGKFLCDGAGRPRLKVHGFGLTSVPLMKEYPWYSCDSSSWIQAAAFGSVITPDHGPIKVSDESPSRHDEGQHITTFSIAERDYLIAKFGEQGFEYERLKINHYSRSAYNLWSFNTINERINHSHDAQYFKAAVQELF